MAENTNPFAFNPTTVATPSPGLLTSGLQNANAPLPAAVTNVDTAQFNPNTPTAKSASAANYSASNAGSQAYNAENMNATSMDVGANQTVQGQTAGLLASNSPLLQRAQAAALEQANSRGLLNSSIAVGMGTNAVLDQALRIATPDAATYNNAAQFNAQAANAAASQNAQAKNAAAQFGANAANTVALANQAAQNQAGQFNAASQNAASSQNAQAQNALQQQQFGLLANAMGQNASAANASAQQNAGFQQQSNLANQQQAFQAGMAQYDAAFKTAMANADAANKGALATLDGQIKTGLAQIEAQFKQQMQVSQSAATMYSQTMQSIGNLLNNKDLDAGARQNAVNQVMGQLRDALLMQNGITKIPGLDTLIGGIGTSFVPEATPLPPGSQAGTGGSGGGGGTGLFPWQENYYRNYNADNP